MSDYQTNAQLLALKDEEIDQLKAEIASLNTKIPPNIALEEIEHEIESGFEFSEDFYGSIRPKLRLLFHNKETEMTQLKERNIWLVDQLRLIQAEITHLKQPKEVY